MPVGDSAGRPDAGGFESLVSDSLKVGADEIGLAVKGHGHGLQALQMYGIMRQNSTFGPLQPPATSCSSTEQTCRPGADPPPPLAD